MCCFILFLQFLNHSLKVRNSIFILHLRYNKTKITLSIYDLWFEEFRHFLCFLQEMEGLKLLLRQQLADMSLFDVVYDFVEDVYFQKLIFWLIVAIT